MKLPRVTAKIFASSADASDIGQFGSALAGTKVLTSDISEIQALPAYEIGWRGAVVSDRNYPTLQEMNGLQKTFSQQLAYIFQQGLPEYDQATEYSSVSFCSSGGKIYRSLQDENQGNPLDDTSYWEEFQGGSQSSSLILGQTVISDSPLYDQRLHLLDGSQYATNGIYENFVNDYLVELQEKEPSRFITEAEWQEFASSSDIVNYWVLDIENQIFRFPRVRDIIFSQMLASTVPVIGNGLTIGLTDGTNNGGLYSVGMSGGGYLANALSGAYGVNVGSSGNYGDYAIKAKSMGLTTDGTKSGIVADLTSLTKKQASFYLYIVVATEPKTQTQIEIDNVAIELQNKANVDLANVPASKGILTESYVNGSSWYRVYSDGWCEQGGTVNTNSGPFFFLKPYKDTNYTLLLADFTNGGNNAYMTYVYKKLTDNFSVSRNGGNSGQYIGWVSYGFIE